MKRRDFIKKAGLLTGNILGAPYILPSGRLFAATGTRLVNHVVFCLFAGGLRNLESVQKAEGNLMPGMLSGTESISGDLVGSMTSLPSSPLSQPLQSFGTLFKEFRYKNGPTGHFNGHTTAITGQYTNSTLSLRDHPEYPTVFELYRKHSSPSKSAINSWWVTKDNDSLPILNYSRHPNYGASFGANNISPADLFRSSVGDAISDMLEFSTGQEEFSDRMKEFMNSKFRIPFGAPISGVQNDPESALKIQNFINKMYLEQASGQHNDPWGAGYMNSDMRNIFYAEQILQEFLPELLVVNVSGVDVCHSDFTGYCDNLRKADWAVAHLWDMIQSTPGLANDTLLIVAPEIGRNSLPNSIMDKNGRYALDHTSSDEMSRELFCIVAGPPGVVNQNSVLSSISGESIDIVPTIAHALGFWDQSSHILPGQPLYQALT